MMKITSVERLGDYIFVVVASDASKSVRSICRLNDEKVFGGQTIKRLKFDSDEFQKLVMTGAIVIKDVSDNINNLSPA